MVTTLRAYQEQAVKDISDKNSVVVMPTGSGKTLVAAECLKIRLSNMCNSKKGLFLVPTCDLVTQQAEVLKDWTKLRAKEFMGGMAIPPISEFDILVSTPDAFRKLQMRQQSFAWSLFSICVFDEVHHVLKDHPYRHLAHGIRRHSEQLMGSAETTEHKIQIIGLSASLTYAVGILEMQKALRNLSNDLSLENMIRVSDEELISGGYKPPSDEIEIVHPRVVPEGIVPHKYRKPHEMHATFFKREKLMSLTSFAQSVLKVVRGLEKVAVSTIGSSFKSPLIEMSLSTWEKYAYDLIKSHPNNADFLYMLETWYVALRILVQTWEEEQELVLLWLKMSNSFGAIEFLAKNECGLGLNEAQTLRRSSENDFNLSKVGCLKEQLLQKKLLFGEEFRCIIFVQQRLTAHILSHFINNHEILSEAGLACDYVTARNAKITPRIKPTPTAVATCIQKFRSGEMNVLVATSVVEEGFDVPASNTVISFDHLKDTVELAQRFGRARREDRKIVVMDQRPDRPISVLKEVKCIQDIQIEGFTPSAETRDINAEREAQANRELNARPLLHIQFNDSNVLQSLKEYVKKTKATETEHSYKDKVADDWVHVWSYSTLLKEKTATAKGQSKHIARKKCALALLTALKD